MIGAVPDDAGAGSATEEGFIMADNKGKKVTHCMLCGKVSELSICETCQIRVQGEALEHKQGIEKKGKTDTGRA
jgi:hypothetical protein